MGNIGQFLHTFWCSCEYPTYCVYFMFYEKWVQREKMLILDLLDLGFIFQLQVGRDPKPQDICTYILVILFTHIHIHMQYTYLPTHNAFCCCDVWRGEL